MVGWHPPYCRLHDAALVQLLGLETRQVLVVPKGSQADSYLLETAREFGVRIVSNDRYRDWGEAHSKMLRPGLLIKGGLRDGQVWLNGLESARGAQ